jgi:hypothetical protein
MSSDFELAGVDLEGDADDPKRLHTRIMGLTQQGRIPAFWCPKRYTLSLPKGVRPWKMLDPKPELGIIIHDPELTRQGQIAIKYHDSTTVVMMLDDFARCGRVYEDKSHITQIYTLRDPCQRDLLGNLHG